MKTCKCGAELQNDSAFCHKCGSNAATGEINRRKSEKFIKTISVIYAVTLLIAVFFPWSLPEGHDPHGVQITFFLFVVIVKVAAIIGLIKSKTWGRDLIVIAAALFFICRVCFVGIEIRNGILDTLFLAISFMEGITVATTYLPPYRTCLTGQSWFHSLVRKKR